MKWWLILLLVATISWEYFGRALLNACEVYNETLCRLYTEEL